MKDGANRLKVITQPRETNSINWQLGSLPEQEDEACVELVIRLRYTNPGNMKYTMLVAHISDIQQANRVMGASVGCSWGYGEIWCKSAVAIAVWVKERKWF